MKRSLLLPMLALSVLSFGCSSTGSEVPTGDHPAEPPDSAPPDMIGEHPQSPTAGTEELQVLSLGELTEVAGLHALGLVADPRNPDHATLPKSDPSSGIATFRLPDEKATARFMRFVPQHPGSDCCLELGPDTQSLAGGLCGLERATEWSVIWAYFYEQEKGESIVQPLLFMTLHCAGKAPLGFTIGDGLSGAKVKGCFAVQSDRPHDHPPGEKR